MNVPLNSGLTGRRDPFRFPGFAVSLVVIALLPLLPELLLSRHTDLKSFVPIAYYELIVSFLLLAPALVLPGSWSRGWVAVSGTVMGLATAIIGFQAVSVGARWDLTAHAALFQTTPGEAWGFVRTFSSPGNWAAAVGVPVAFAVAIYLHWRSPRIPPRAAVGVLILGLGASAPGISHAIRYGGSLTRPVGLNDGSVLQIVNLRINELHPVTLLLCTHYNYRATHDYYLQADRRLASQLDRLQGAKTAPGAVLPRNLIFVIGESASRRHWSLYGYPRDTNPGLTRLRDEIMLFTDTISASVGTQAVLRGMFTTSRLALPFFPILSQAGFHTSWLSTQYNQGANDVEIASLVQSCEQKRFLNGGYDENLLPLAAEALAAPGNHALFLNLFGSHVRYRDRYPASWAYFHGDTEKTSRIADYDNTIRYTDQVLAQLIELIKSRHESSALLYVSDHAEDVYDSVAESYLFRNETIATNAMYEVPFFVWLSPEYRRDNPTAAAAIAAARNRPFQTLPLYPSLLDLARLEHPLADPRQSLFSDHYEERPRRIGIMHRVYRQNRANEAAGSPAPAGALQH